MLVQVELRRMSLGNLTLQVNYAVGRLVAVIVYCFSGDLNLLVITVYIEMYMGCSITVTGASMTG